MAGKRKGMGWLRDAPDYRDYRYGPPTAVLAAPTPDRVDLREAKNAKGQTAMPRIFDQLALGSCVANAANATVQFVERKDADPDADRLSRLWTYWYSREKIGTVDEDSGSMIRDAFAVLTERGTPRERYWPYKIERFRDKPTEGERSAPHHRILEYRSILDQSQQDMMACLAEGYPFVYGFAVYDSFWSVTSEGWWDGSRGSIAGYHAVTCVGYDFSADPHHWIIRNSWGTRWGDAGYFYVPRAYLPLEAFDCWTARTVTR